MPGILSSFAISLLGAAAIGQTAPAGRTDPATLSEEPGFHSVRAINSEKASGIVDAANQARNDIAQGDRRAAVDQVTRALSLQQSLDRTGPKDQLVPVYAELVRMSTSDPSTVVGKGRIKHLDTPREKTDIYAGKNQLSTADRMTTVAQPATSQVVKPAFTRVSLDTVAAEKHLNAAREALDREDNKTADRELSAVQNAVISETVPADVPLVRARENLAQAARQAQRGDDNTAALSVHAAAEALESYSGSGATADAAHALAREIQLPAGQGSEHLSAGRIESWWDRVAQLEAR